MFAWSVMFQEPITVTTLFFACRMDYGDWSNNSRGTYNKWDGIARTTTQVYFYVAPPKLFKVLVSENFIFSQSSQMHH